MGNERKEPVAHVKARLSEFVSLSSVQGTRIVITRRGKPVAALVSVNDLETLSQSDRRAGLADLRGRWEGFEEISVAIEHAQRKGRSSKNRDVSV